MICVKVVSGCIKNCVTYSKQTWFAKRLDAAFSLKSEKVKVYSTHNAMTDLLQPPSLNGMKVLDRDAFKKTVTVPCLIVDCKSFNEVMKIVKKFLIKVVSLKPVQVLENEKRRIFFNPNIVNSWNDLTEGINNELEKLNITSENFSQVNLELGYENWSADALLKAVLPKDTVSLRSFSLIGHIIHLNIKDNLLDYKHIIAEILYDKVSLAKTVICKTNIIDNVYRNFKMEVLIGEPNFFTSVSENQCKFEFDFSTVYWNPRLSTEHSRIIKLVNERDVLFDVFAGVGPFAIPAAKKRCTVFANDLNPESVKWLQHNININKRAKDYITYYNKDGRDFILEDVKENLIKTWKDDLFGGKIMVVMNLPVIAPTFMKYFKGLVKRSDLTGLDVENVKKCLPIINCYFFTHGEECEKKVFEEQSEMNLENVEHSFHFVRKVSNSGSMIRIMFSLPYEYLTEDCEAVECGEPLPKRICTE